MEPSTLSSSLIILLLCLFHGAHAAGDIISDTCKKAAGPTLKYDFCVSTLQSDPNSHNADLHGLGVIAMKLSIAKATSIESHIKNLLKDEEQNPKAKTCLKECLEGYTDAISDINDAIESLDAKDYGGANVHMSVAYDAADACEDEFKEAGGLPSPLTKENEDFAQLTVIGLAITNLFN